MNKISDIGDEFIAAHRPMPDDLLLRVAALAGWENVAKSTLSDHYFGTKDGDSRGYPIPVYTTSLDVIVAAFKDLELSWSLDNYDESGFFYASDKDIECLDKSPAIALCKLLVKISEKIE